MAPVADGAAHPVADGAADAHADPPADSGADAAPDRTDTRIRPQHRAPCPPQSRVPLPLRSRARDQPLLLQVHRRSDVRRPRPCPLPTPSAVPQPAPSPAPTLNPTPAPTTNPTSVPTPIPTPSPTRTPIVLAVVGLAGINCSEFDAAVYNEALMTILSNATMSEADCVFTGDSTAESVELTSEITMPLAIGLEAGYTVMNYALSFLELSVSDGSFTAAIQVKAQCVRLTTSRYVHTHPRGPVPLRAPSGGCRRAAATTRRNGSRRRVGRERAWASVEHGGRVGHLALGQHVLADARAQPCANDGDANRFADRDVLAHDGPDPAPVPPCCEPCASRWECGYPAASKVHYVGSRAMRCACWEYDPNCMPITFTGAALQGAARAILLIVFAGLQRPHPLFLYLRFPGCAAHLAFRHVEKFRPQRPMRPGLSTRKPALLRARPTFH